MDTASYIDPTSLYSVLCCDYHLVVLTLFIRAKLHFGDISLELAKVDLLLEP